MRKTKVLHSFFYMNDEGTDLFDSETNESLLLLNIYSASKRKTHCDF